MMPGHLTFVELARRELANAPCQVLLWDGRLDNRADLQWRLREVITGEVTGAELARAAFQRWGIAGLGELIGDWSVVISDPRSRAVVFASDYAGVRPLYYARGTRGVSWSTRLASLVAAHGGETLDETYVAGFLTLGACPTRTPYAGIRSVPPGHAVAVTPADTIVHRFWTPPTGDRVVYDDERRYEEQVRHLFREAVAARLQTPAPVIAELSGGLDSSAVVLMASQLIAAGAVPAPQLMTVSYVHRDSLDVAFMREVEACCGTTTVHLSTDELPLVRPEQVGTAKPEAWLPLHQAVAATAARFGAEVLLTGQNGDLVMGNWIDDSLQVAAPLRAWRPGEAAVQALAWSKALRIPVASVLGRAARAVLPGAAARHELFAMDGMSGADDRPTSLLPSFATRTGAGQLRHWISDDWVAAPVERRAHFRALTVMRELLTLQPFEPLQSIDYTHPFAHRPLVEFLMTVPADVLCRPGEPRRLMRRAFADLFPPRLRKRRSKSLFGRPWFDALTPLAHGLLASARWEVVERGWVDRDSFTTRLVRLTRGLDCNETQLRHIILFEYWLRNRARSESPGTLTYGMERHDDAHDHVA